MALVVELLLARVVPREDAESQRGAQPDVLGDVLMVIGVLGSDDLLNALGDGNHRKSMSHQIGVVLIIIMTELAPLLSIVRKHRILRAFILILM